MSQPYLLDANVLIALAISDHEHHDQASAWASRVDRLALCPIVEGALVRFLVRIGESSGTAESLLGALHASQRCVFWADSLSYADVDLGSIVGHRQVTDAYLVALAASHETVLATFDCGLAAAHRNSVELIPTA